jgi:chloramphenicol-sensitive protein RarD
MAPGLVTGGPLILLAYAMQRASMAMIGLVRCPKPTLQLPCAAVVFGEPSTLWHEIAFALIRAAVLLYAVASFRSERAARRASASAATSGTVVL